jgi:hypothetical protein
MRCPISKIEDDAMMQLVARTEESEFRVQMSENASSRNTFNEHEDHCIRRRPRGAIARARRV